MIANIALLLARYVDFRRSTYDRVGHKALRRLSSGGPREADVRPDDVTRPNAGVQERHRQWAELAGNRMADSKRPW